MAPQPRTRTAPSSAASAAYSGPYAALVNQSARRYGVPPLLLAALLKTESGFNPNARSGAGAVGIAQFMPATARGMGVNPLDPASAIPGAARYLAGAARAAGGSWDAALRRYNTGSSAPSAAGTAYVDQVRASLRDLGGSNTDTTHTSGSPGLAALIKKLLGEGYGKIIGTPYVGTHTLYGNWESDNAFDFALPVGTPIYALAAGKIGPQIGPLAGAGADPRLLGLRLHLVTPGNEFYYAHLSRLVVKAGQTVKQGQLLGYSGSANGVAHLHLAAKNGGQHLTTGQGESFQSAIVGGVAANAGKVGSGALGFLSGVTGLAGAAGAATGVVGGLIGGPVKSAEALGALASRILEDPAYPLLWLLFVLLGLALMLLGILRMTGTKPADVAQVATTAAKVGAVA